jgi:anaerobic magnesium-protoporphyrin IX monomethyl ester cyclase
MSTRLTMANSGYQMSSDNACCELGGSNLPIVHPGKLKVHCILPSSPWLADSKTNIPLGVLYIAGLLRAQGHDVVVTSMLDKRYEGHIHLPDAVMDADVHMFGFCTPQFGEALELAAYIKDRNPRALLVAGGPHPSYEPREVKEAGRQEQYHFKGRLVQRRDYTAFDGSAPLFDTVVVMEGERAVLQLLSDWKQGQLQPYYYGDKADAMDLDAIPYPAWDLLPDDHIYNDGVAVMKKKYVESSVRAGSWPVMSLIGTRGCPYKCTYCSTPWIGQKPRYRSPGNIIGEMQQVMDRGVHMFKFQDDTYTLHRTKLRDLAEQLNAHFGYGSFAARIHTRVNTMDDHVAESLKLMNCKVTCFGIESGSQKVLDANQKGTKVQQNTDAIKRAKDHGFYTIAFLVIGMSGETLQTMDETQNWLLSVKGELDSCNLAVGIPYPGSRWWTHPHESGIEIFDYNYDNQWIVGFSARDEIIVRPYGVTVEEMFRIKKDMFDFQVANGWAKAEWDEDVRIKRQQEDAAKQGVLAAGRSYTTTDDGGTAAGSLTYAGH